MANRRERRAKVSTERKAAVPQIPIPALELPPTLEKVDPLNFSTTPIQTYYGETPLSYATGFFYFGFLEGRPNWWLITNWHVFSGRNADAPAICLDRNGAIPNRIRLNLFLRSDQPEYSDRSPSLGPLMQEQFIDLYDVEGDAAWYQHPQKNSFDVAAINLSVLTDRCLMVGVNQPKNQWDMAIEVGSAVFILGYPLGYRHFIETPIWKHGVIGSEPHLETPEMKNRVVIDATTRPGMSGSPVIMREKTHYLAETGDIKRHPNATRFIGIYASRPRMSLPAGMDEADGNPEIGFFYKSSCVEKTLAEGIRGPRHGELP
jgi:hypothetical protein